MHSSRSAYFFAFLLFSTNVFAESYRMNASYFVRGTPNFSSQDENKVGVLTKGSSFNVLKTVPMSDGAEALEIHVVSLSPTSNLNPSKNYWIYKTKGQDFTPLTDRKRETEAGSPDVPCKDCIKAAEGATRNRKDLGDVSTAITRQDNVVPESSVLERRAPGSLDEKIKNYSESDQVEYVIGAALRNKHGRSQGGCYLGVKKALLAHPKGKKGLIPYHYSDEAALGAKQTLKNYGFINLLDTEPYKTQMKSPAQAPKGAVLVYSSGIPCRNSTIADCGHIEIKTGRPGSNAYVSDYSDDTAINETPAARRYGTRYKLVGVMIKPMD